MAIGNVKNPVIALLGQPNSGKSTLFNELTGLRQHVGNWPGKTVEQKEGHFVRNNVRYTVVDLPGTYSLSANSEEEVITRDYIAEGQADAVCILADASQLERSLFMLADFAGIHVPVFVVLNMMDVAKAQGKRIDAAVLQRRLEVPVVLFSATDNRHYDVFFRALNKVINEKPLLNVETLVKLYSNITKFDEIKKLMPIKGIQDYSADWLAVKAIESDAPILTQIQKRITEDKRIKLAGILAGNKNGALLTGEQKFKWIDELLRGALKENRKSAALGRFDKFALSKDWGKPLAILIILFGVIAAFIPAVPFMLAGSRIPSVLTPLLSSFLNGMGAPEFLVGLISEGCVNALYLSVSMAGFVFGITLVFGLIEEIGYMARISYVFDYSMSKLGLQGKAIMPFLVSLGCTIGGAAGARVIDNRGQRILTIALAWAVPCGATWAIIPIIASVFFGTRAPLVIIAIFLMTIFHMWITSKVFSRHLVKKEEKTGLIMELPPYHRPNWRSLFQYVCCRTRDILFRVMKVIIFVSIMFWILTYSKDGNVNHSIIYKIGKSIEPVTLMFGLRWQTFLAFISSAVSKEAALGVLSSLYTGTGTVFSSTIGSTGQTSYLGDILAANIAPAEALAFLFAVTFNVPCVMSVASTYQEIHSVKWTAGIALYYMVMALILAFLVYHIGLFIF